MPTGLITVLSKEQQVPMKVQHITGVIAMNQSRWHAIGITRPYSIHYKIKQAVLFSWL